MSELTTKEVDKFQKVEELLNLKRKIKEEKKAVTELMKERLIPLRAECEKLSVPLTEIDEKIADLDGGYDAVFELINDSFKSACMDAGK